MFYENVQLKKKNSIFFEFLTKKSLIDYKNC